MARFDLAKELGSVIRQRDKTFTDFDIIRIACLNLTRSELRNVILFFMIGVPLILASEQLDWLFTGLKVPKTLSRLFNLIIKSFIGDTLLQILLSFGFKLSYNDIKVLTDCVVRLQKLFPR